MRDLILKWKVNRWQGDDVYQYYGSLDVYIPLQQSIVLDQAMFDSITTSL